MSVEEAWREKRQKLMEIMVKTHLITTDLANYHIEKMTDRQLDEELEMYAKQRNAK